MSNLSIFPLPHPYRTPRDKVTWVSNCENLRFAGELRILRPQSLAALHAKGNRGRRIRSATKAKTALCCHRNFSRYLSCSFDFRRAANRAFRIFQRCAVKPHRFEAPSVDATRRSDLNTRRGLLPHSTRQSFLTPPPLGLCTAGLFRGHPNKLVPALQVALTGAANHPATAQCRRPSGQTLRGFGHCFPREQVQRRP